MLNRALQVGTYLFVPSTLVLLTLTRLPAINQAPEPPRLELLLMFLTVATLPFALAKVVREADPKSRRNWAILTALCVILISVVFLFGK